MGNQTDSTVYTVSVVDTTTGGLVGDRQAAVGLTAAKKDILTRIQGMLADLGDPESVSDVSRREDIETEIHALTEAQYHMTTLPVLGGEAYAGALRFEVRPADF